MKVTIVVLSCVFAAAYGTGLDLSKLGDPCEAKDGECCTKKISGLIPLILKLLGEPLVIPKLVVKPGKGLLQLDQELTNVKVEGLNGLQVKDLKLDLSGGTIKLKVFAKQIKLITDYLINGRLLLVPLWGKGRGIFTLSDVNAAADLTISINKGKVLLTGIKLSVTVGNLGLSLSSLFGETKTKILTPLYEKALCIDAKLVLQEVLPEYLCAIESVIVKLLGPIISSLDLSLLLKLII